MQWWSIVLEFWETDPWWLVGLMVLLFLQIGFYSFSFFRRWRTLAWFYGAGLLSAWMFFFAMGKFPFLLEWLSSYRSDWSLVYLVQTYGFKEILTELVMYHLYYGALATSMVLVLLIYALLTFQWKRLISMTARIFQQSGFVVFFSFLTLFAQRLWPFVYEVSGENMESFLEVFAFLFVFQLMVRLLDTARLDSPRLFLEFFYAVGLGFLIMRFGFFVPHWVRESTEIHAVFFEQVFLFFFVVLILGLLLSYAIRAYFISPFFHSQFRSVLALFSRRDSFAEKERYVPYQFLQGLILSSLVAFLFLLFLFQGWIRPLVLCFFGGYFWLFYLLDHLEDMKTRGDLVPQRVHSVHNKTFTKP